MPVRQLSVAPTRARSPYSWHASVLYWYHTHAKNAAACIPAFTRLAKMACMPLDGFAKQLCETCPDFVSLGRVDAVEELTPATVLTRQTAYDVWAGRSVWHSSSSPGPMGRSVDPETSALCIGVMVIVPACGRTIKTSPSCLLDAATMSSGDRAPEMWRRPAFQRTDVRYPPEEVHATDPVGSQMWANILYGGPDPPRV